MSKENSFNVNFGNKTDVGKVRQRNEDYMECFKSSFGEVFIVCDGMGGHEGGEIASRLAVATIKQIIIANPNGLTSPASIIEESISLANKAIISKSEETNVLKGMGTTCVVLIIRGDKAFYGHVGDSRIYLVRGNHIYLMTRDHSFVQGLVDQGLISWEEAESHPRKNEISQALGIFEKIDPEVNNNPLQLYKDDKFILCSDGLSGYVPEDVLLDTVLKYNPVEASNRLVESANNNGGPDNITVQIIEIINAKQLPKDKQFMLPEGFVNRSTLKIHQNSVTKEINNDNPKLFQLSSKQRSIVPYIAGGFGVLLISLLIIFNPFATNNGPSFTNKTIDSNKVTNTQKDLDTLKDSLAQVLKISLIQLYNGKSTPINLNTSLKISNNFTYQGSFNSAVQNFDMTDLIMNIQKNDLKFKNISKPLKKIGIDTFKCKLTVMFKDKENIYEIRFIINDKYFVLQSIEFLNSTDQRINNKPIDKPKVKKTDTLVDNKNNIKTDESDNAENNKVEVKDNKPIKDDKPPIEDTVKK